MRTYDAAGHSEDFVWFLAVNWHWTIFRSGLARPGTDLAASIRMTRSCG
jgi:hypothetical protein